MKRIILTLLLSSLGFVSTLAQSQLGMNYQAVIRNADGKIIADTRVGIQINILKESTSGESVYTETFTPITNEFGLITLVIGQGQAKYGKYSSIDWSSTNYFLKIELDIAGGTAYEEMGVSQLLSVPYANYAFDGVGGKSAYQIWIDRGNTGSEEDFINSITGPPGKSAYQIWVDRGNTGSEGDFINSLTGPSGKSAYQAWLDLGNTGTLQEFINSISAVGRSVYDIWLGLGNIGTQQDFINSITGQSGPSGKSAYQAWLDLGNTGTQQDFINSITGQSGPSGKSAYQVWLEQPGNDAKTEEDFINSITGVSGKSAYQVWLDLGNIGTEDAFISSLTGPSGTSSWDDAETNVSTKNKVQVISDGKNPEVPLLEVKNSKGETIFAVYENGVKIILDEETGGEKNRGGFAISGRTTTKEGETDIFIVTPSLTEVFVDEPTAKNRGGFAISGRTTTKTPAELLNITPSLTQFYVDENTTKNRGGFAISGRTTTKEGEADIFTVTPSLTEVFVDEPTAKNRGGFAISGRTTTKVPAELLNITPSLTQFYVDENTTKNRGGFAISGRTTTKEGEADILTVTPSLTEVFVDEPTAKNRGGFAISGRTTTKVPAELINITPSLTQFYVDENTTKNRGGFAISGRTTTKEGEADILTVTPNLTQVFVEETTTKNRGGFAISGRTTTKSSGIYDVLTVVPERTDIYVKPSPSKNSLPIGFGVHGLADNTLESTEFFSISNAGTYVATPMAVSLNVTTGIIIDITQTSAMGGGKVADACCVTNITGITSGIVYHTDTKLLTVEEASNLTMGEGGVVSAGESDNFSGLQMLDLKPGTKYKVRAFATDADGLTGYGLPREFTTLPAYKLTINVTGDGGTPLNAMVTLWKQDAQEPIISKEQLSSHTFSLSQSQYAYMLEAEGYKPESGSLIMESSQVININLSKITNNKVTFTVKTQHGIAPLDTIGIRLYQGYNSYTGHTNSKGIVTFDLPTGELNFNVDTDYGYDQYTGNTNYTVNAGENNIPITLQKQHKVTFNVKDHNGIPVTGGEIILTNPDNPEEIISVYDGTGSTYLSSALSVEGNWDYKITSYQGGLPLKGTITVGKEDLVVNVRLPAPIIEYTVKFKILNIDSSPIVGARINLSHLPDLYNGQGITDINGLVTFTKVLATNTPASAYNLTVFEDEVEIWYQSIEFSENLESDEPSDPIGTLTITITLEP